MSSHIGFDDPSDAIGTDEYVINVVNPPQMPVVKSRCLPNMTIIPNTSHQCL